MIELMWYFIFIACLAAGLILFAVFLPKLALITYTFVLILTVNNMLIQVLDDPNEK